MKKILLVIAITFLIFQVIVLAVAIDIGSGATERGTQQGGNFTFVDINNPANDTGTITSFEIWAQANMASVEVATFYVVSGNNLTTRDWETIGAVESGAKRTFEVNLDVQTGDYLGIFWTSGGLYIDTAGGSGYWNKPADYIPCDNVLFTRGYNWLLSIYGTGTTGEEEEEANAISFGTNF